MQLQKRICDIPVENGCEVDAGSDEEGDAGMNEEEEDAGRVEEVVVWRGVETGATRSKGEVKSSISSSKSMTLAGEITVVALVVETEEEEYEW